MFDDFFIRALIAGLGIAIVTGPLGCFVIWRRLSYFGGCNCLINNNITYSINIKLVVFIIV